MGGEACSQLQNGYGQPGGDKSELCSEIKGRVFARGPHVAAYGWLQSLPRQYRYIYFVL